MGICILQRSHITSINIYPIYDYEYLIILNLDSFRGGKNWGEVKPKRYGCDETSVQYRQMDDANAGRKLTQHDSRPHLYTFTTDFVIHTSTTRGCCPRCSAYAWKNREFYIRTCWNVMPVENIIYIYMYSMYTYCIYSIHQYIIWT